MVLIVSFHSSSISLGITTFHTLDTVKELKKSRSKFCKPAPSSRVASSQDHYSKWKCLMESFSIFSICEEILRCEFLDCANLGFTPITQNKIHLWRGHSRAVWASFWYLDCGRGPEFESLQGQIFFCFRDGKLDPPRIDGDVTSNK